MSFRIGKRFLRPLNIDQDPAFAALGVSEMGESLATLRKQCVISSASMVNSVRPFLEIASEIRFYKVTQAINFEKRQLNEVEPHHVPQGLQADRLDFSNVITKLLTHI
eukprot:Lithocolla_globosa_v1_NODE_1039_length_2923_cov_6.165969.p3 type:complete len:108 gc:universal NODE_1039_length_2923_cov_6.165969:2546-2223(-)